MEGTLESKEGQVIIAGTFKGNVTAKSLIIENTSQFNCYYINIYLFK